MKAYLLPSVPKLKISKLMKSAHSLYHLEVQSPTAMANTNLTRLRNVTEKPKLSVLLNVQNHLVLIVPYYRLQKKTLPAGIV
jgi:hypothetical protein